MNEWRVYKLIDGCMKVLNLHDKGLHQSKKLQGPQFKWQNPKNNLQVINQDIRYGLYSYLVSEKAMAPHSSTLAWKIPWMEEPEKLQSMGSLRFRHDWATSLSLFTFTFHFHALEKEMATHSSVLAWRIPGMGEPGGLPSMGWHRVRHDWSDLAAAEFSCGANGTSKVPKCCN